jgi:hypothetical protein
MHRKFAFIILILFCSALWAADNSKLQVWRAGNVEDVTAKPGAGFALMGGGKDLDDAFKFLCDKSGGGDFVILRASGTDAYNPYVAGLCKLNSVTNYVNFWQGTPVQSALNDAIRRGVPIGGTSAGLAVLGQFVFAALHDTAYSAQTLADPFNDGVTITRDFVEIPLLQNTITDTHFVKRDRQGRLLGFMARIVHDGMAKRVRGIGVDERVAVLLEPTGSVKVVGTGAAAYFFNPTAAPEQCVAGKPLTYRGIDVLKVVPGDSFDVKNWKSDSGTRYTLSVVDGVVSSSGGAVY